MENNIYNAKAFITKWRDERTHPVSTDYFAELIVAYASSVSEPKEIKLPSDEEIEIAVIHYNGSAKVKYTIETWDMASFRKGAKWVITQLNHINQPEAKKD